VTVVVTAAVPRKRGRPVQDANIVWTGRLGSVSPSPLSVTVPPAAVSDFGRRNRQTSSGSVMISTIAGPSIANASASASSTSAASVTRAPCAPHNHA
jgi:hypothetical protein